MRPRAARALSDGGVLAGRRRGVRISDAHARCPRSATTGRRFAERADIAYAVYAPEQRHAVEVAASQQDHLVNWLSKRLNRTVTIPSLAEYGFQLVGGRLLPGEEGPAAQFMYQNAAGERLTLYMTTVTRSATTARSACCATGRARRYYWAGNRVGYALSGQIGEEKLQAIAYDTCKELGGDPKNW